MVTEILWGDGTGDKIYLTYTAASGSQTIMVSSDANAGPARTKDITFVSSIGNIARVLTVTQETNMDYVSITWNDTCITYDDTAIAYPYEEEYIVFEDPVMEAICATNWGDGTGIKPSQAAQVTAASLTSVFRGNTDISVFNEFRYFVNALNAYMFRDSTLTKVTFPPDLVIPNNGSTFGSYFYGCAELEDVNFNGLVRDPAAATATFSIFNGCSSLTTVRFKDLESMLGFYRDSTNFASSEHPFSANSDTHYVYIGGEEVTVFNIPSTVTRIPGGTFYRFNRVTSITIPSSVSYIGPDAFNGCASLESLTINTDVTTNCFVDAGTTDGVLTINGDLDYSYQNFNGYLKFGTVIINGDFICGTSHTAHAIGRQNSYGTYDFVLKISGDVYPRNSIQFVYNEDVVFLEIGGQIIPPTTGCKMWNTVKQGCIIHLGYNGIAVSRANYLMTGAAVISRIDKIYVDSQAVLDLYTADSEWSTYSAKFDLWSNYSGLYKD